MDPGVEARVPDGIFAKPLGEEALTLAEILRAYGYRTAAVVANYGYLYRAFGCSQGFELYDDRTGPDVHFVPMTFAWLLRQGTHWPWVAHLTHRTYRSAQDINRTVFRWLRDHRSERFFLFVNYVDTHAPYVPRPPFARRFPGWLPGRLLWYPFDQVLGGDYVMEAKDRSHLEALYDGELAYLDEHVGRLIAYLRKLGLYEPSLIVVVGDHGESFGEHRLLGHGNSLYEVELRIPLIVKWPHQVRKGRVLQRVQNVDVLPTVLSILGYPIPDSVEADPLSDVSHPIVAHHSPNTQRAMRFGGRFRRTLEVLYQEGWKLIASSDGQHELYDLMSDPEETRNLAAVQPEKVRLGLEVLRARRRAGPVHLR
jgi:arylsulfatase A-like enzyme